jgi:hypothetical protein
MPSSTRPEPVLDAAKIAAAVSGTVTAVGAVFVIVGWATSEQVQSWAVIAGGIVTALGTLVSIVLPIITALGARAQVTPLAAPVGVDGVPLVAALLEYLDDEPAAAVAEPAPATAPMAAVRWTPPTPAAVAAEPTPIEAEVAAATSRIG